MSKIIPDGDFYIKNRNNQEQKLKKNENGIEGFDVISRKFQQKNPSKFNIPQNSDPGQTVMCQLDKIRYVRLSQQNNYLHVQEVEVYDEKGKNVALAGSFSNNYQLTKGKCRTNYNTTGAGWGNLTSPKNKGNLTVKQCEDKCSQDNTCSAYEIQSEESTEGINPNCWTYSYPSVTGNGDPNEMCRVRERLPGTPTATMSPEYWNGDAYMAINGNHNPQQKWPNSIHTRTNRGGWWELDLGKLVNVKKIVIYNRPDCCQSRLNGATVSLIDRDHNTVWTKTLNSNRRQEFQVKLSNQNCGGPVVEKNLDDFNELKDLQLQFNRELQEYNQAVKDLMDNSRKYISASNKSNNEFANVFVTEPHTTTSPEFLHCSQNAGSYQSDLNVTSFNACKQRAADKGSNVFSMGPNESSNISIDITIGSNKYAGTSGKGLVRWLYRDKTYSNNEEIFNGVSKGQSISKTFNPPGSPIGAQLTCSSNDGYYISAISFNGIASSNIGWIDLDSPGKWPVNRDYTLSPPNDETRRGKCYIGNGSELESDSCSIPSVYSVYQTQGANNSNLNKTYHITDTEANLIPNGPMNTKGVKNAPSDFQVINNFNSWGDDIVGGQGNSSNIEEIKQKCIETPGCTGFVYRPSYKQYWLKNANMWPNGNRQPDTTLNLYIRTPKLDLNSSCNSNHIGMITQDMFNYSMGSDMTSQIKCGLGIISTRDNENINAQYKRLNVILDKIHANIIKLSAEDIILNQKLLGEYKLLKNRLNKYEEVYKNIKKSKKMGDHNAALEEDANLNMLSYNQQYILWSIVALGITIGAMKYMK